MIQTLERHPHTGSQYLPLAEFAANNSVNMAMGYSTFYLNSSYHPLAPSILMHGGCCALCPGVVDWHNCGNVLGALEFGWGLVCTIYTHCCDIYRGNGAPLNVL